MEGDNFQRERRAIFGNASIKKCKHVYKLVVNNIHLYRGKLLMAREGKFWISF